MINHIKVNNFMSEKFYKEMDTEYTHFLLYTDVIAF